ncbi:hypothetical protein BU15DRAFT_11718, partial [Melanogaster broomeanus]
VVIKSGDHLAAGQHLHSPSHTTPSAGAPQPPCARQTHPMLTDDQADFVNTLCTNNVPAAAVARVMERMMA